MMQTEPRVEMILLPELELIGYEFVTSTEDGRNRREIPAFWDQFFKNGLGQRLPQSTTPDLHVAACWDEKPDGAFRYLVSVPVRSGTVPGEGQVRLTVPAGRHARVTARGEMSRAIPDAFAWFHRTWLPASGEVIGTGPCLEWYDHRAMSGEECEVDLFIPLS